MTRYTRADAARILGISVTTLDRKIAAGELDTAKEPFGSRDRVYVLLEDTPPVTTPAPAGDDTGAPGETILGERLKAAEALAEYRGELLKEADLRLQMVLGNLDKAQTTIETLTRALPAPEPVAQASTRSRSWPWPWRSR